jgi:hypothetical protein
LSHGAFVAGDLDLRADGRTPFLEDFAKVHLGEDFAEGVGLGEEEAGVYRVE